MLLAQSVGDTFALTVIFTFMRACTIVQDVKASGVPERLQLKLFWWILLFVWSNVIHSYLCGLFVSQSYNMCWTLRSIHGIKVEAMCFLVPPCKLLACSLLFLAEMNLLDMWGQISYVYAGLSWIWKENISFKNHSMNWYWKAFITVKDGNRSILAANRPRTNNINIFLCSDAFLGNNLHCI